MGPRPVANIVIIILLVAGLVFGAYLTFNMALTAAQPPPPPTAAAV
jgi:hypothetical protein